MYKKIGALCTVIVMGLMPLSLPMSVDAAPDTLLVPEDFSSIQDAVDAAHDGDTVSIGSGTYTEHVSITKDIIIRGNGPANTIISGGGTGDIITLQHCSVTIRDLSLRDSGTYNGNAGIKLLRADSCTVRNVAIERCRDGVAAYMSRSLSVLNCTINGNYQSGIYLLNSHDSRLINNTLADNVKQGIYLRASDDSVIAHNRVSTTPAYLAPTGIYLYLADRCLVKNNTVAGNWIGISLASSRDTLLYHNRLCHNRLYNARDTLHARAAGHNTWDAGYPTGGNYWSDYDDGSEGAYDDFHGDSQSIPGYDGIVDTAYTGIGRSNEDRYPLMPPPVPAALDVKPEMLAQKSKGRWITCYLELPDGYLVEDINVSTLLFNRTVPAEEHPTAIGDYDRDGAADLMVKFDRRQVQSILSPGDGVMVSVTGQLYNTTAIRGMTTLRVR